MRRQRRCQTSLITHSPLAHCRHQAGGETRRVDCRHEGRMEMVMRIRDMSVDPHLQLLRITEYSVLVGTEFVPSRVCMCIIHIIHIYIMYYMYIHNTHTPFLIPPRPANPCTPSGRAASLFSSFSFFSFELSLEPAVHNILHIYVCTYSTYINRGIFPSHEH